MDRLADNVYSGITDYLNCSICLQLATFAVETNCCHNIYCETCITTAKASKDCCPSCRKGKFMFTTNYLARRMVNSMPGECLHKCGTPLTRGDLEEHQRKCGKRPCDAINENGRPSEKLQLENLRTLYGLACAALGRGDKISKLKKKGNVSGYYLQYDRQHPLQGTFTLKKGMFKFQTKDSVGPAIWEGKISLDGERVKLIKRYNESYSIEYHGKINQELTIIQGQWKMGYLSDNFKLFLQKA